MSLEREKMVNMVVAFVCSSLGHSRKNHGEGIGIPLLVRVRAFSGLRPSALRACVRVCVRACACESASMYGRLSVCLCMCVFTLAQPIGSLFLASNRDFNVFCLAVLAAHTLAFALGQHVFPPRPPPPGGSPMAVNAEASGSEGERRVQVGSDGSLAAAVQQDGSGRALPGSGERGAGEETLTMR